MLTDRLIAGSSLLLTDCNMTALFVTRTRDEADLTIDLLSIQARAGLHENMKSRRMP